MRLQLNTEASPGALLDLPWHQPLEDWVDERMVEVRQRGLSRHVVRFASVEGDLYALKEIPTRFARREHGLLRWLAEREIPCVRAVGVVDGRGGDLDAILVTRFLDYSLSYRTLFSGHRDTDLLDRLLDALVELLVRLHVAGFQWGDCSLSNTLFRRDAGALEAYLVDAETGAVHPTLSDGQRRYDLQQAEEHTYGELLDLQAGGLLPDNIDPVSVARAITVRYRCLWEELTREELIPPGEQRWRLDNRLRRLNQLGFDVEEVELISEEGGTRLRLRTRVAEPGHYRRQLLMRTGLNVHENQALRLLNDMAGYRGHLERKDGRRLPETVAANRWLDEVFEPVVAAVPDELRYKREPAEVFHEILEHRWFLSERAGRDVGTTTALRSYLREVLPAAAE